MKKLLKSMAGLLCLAMLTGCAREAFGPEQLQTQPPAETTGAAEETKWEWSGASALEDRQLSAQQAFVYDCQTGEFLSMVGEAGDKIYPASITKLFSAYVALRFLAPDREVTAGDALELVGYGSSVAEIQAGDVLTVEMLVAAMMLPSGNDAAYILAVEAGREAAKDPSMPAAAAVERFMKEVNGQLRVNRFTGTQFTDPDGYHDYDHYTNPADLAAMAKLVMEDETVMKYAGMPRLELELVSGQQHSWENTNWLLHPESEFYCPYAIGLKTGQTPTAGSCLLSAFEVEGKQYLIGVFGCPEIEDRFLDTLLLLQQIPGVQ